jgi:hypothetical protein
MINLGRNIRSRVYSRVKAWLFFFKNWGYKRTSCEEFVMEPKETLEKAQTETTSQPPLESLEKEVCWDKPFTLSGGCCQD